MDLPFKKVLVLYKDIQVRLGKKFTFSILFSLLASFLDGIAISLLIPILNVLKNSEPEADSAFFKFVFYFSDRLHIHNRLLFLLGLFVCLSLIQYTVVVLSSFYASKSKFDYVKIWREELTRSLLNAKWRFFIENECSKILNAIHHSSDSVGSVVNYFIQSISIVFSIFIYFTIALFISWKATIALSLIGLILLSVIIPFLTMVSSIGKRINKEHEGMALWTKEVVTGAKYIKSTGGEAFLLKKFNKFNQEISYLSSQSSFHADFISNIYQFLTITILVTSLVMSVKIFHLPLVNTLLILGIFFRLYPKCTSLSNNIYLLKLNLPAYEFLNEMISKMRIYQEPPNQPHNLIELDDTTIAFNQAVVYYDSIKALKGISLSIRDKSFTALVGESGSGKTTILDALMKLIDLDEGSIMIGDQDIASYSISDLRSVIGYVSQDTVLFKGTILENVVWGAKDYDLKEVECALEAANAMEFVKQFDKNVYHDVGDSGIHLSGGQRQRIGIARALFHKKKILVLDEPTSALDPISEKLVIDSLCKLKERMTILMVAHRLSTIKQADYIYVIKNGLVSESGTWDQLMANDAAFKRFYRVQSLSKKTVEVH